LKIQRREKLADRKISLPLPSSPAFEINNQYLENVSGSS